MCWILLYLYNIKITQKLKIKQMKAQINTLNSDCILVSLYNTKEIVDQKYFETERKAINYCKKYSFEIIAMNEDIDESMMFEK